MVIVKRMAELKQIKNLGDWIWICGRRKTGKTFFVKNFLKFDEYFFVKRDGSVLRNDKELSFDTFFELFKELIKHKTIIIDEFHRLPETFFDYLHASKQGKLIAISSTLWLSKKLLGKGSPLMGLFSMLIFGLINESDVLNALNKLKLSKKELVEASTFIREPMLAMNYKPKIRDWLATFLEANKLAISEIIGEIFTEEERQLSLIYEGILKAIASGKNKSSEISNYLFSKKLIKKDNPGFIQRYLDVLVKIGLVEKLEVYNKKKFVYRNVSPLFDIHFYLDDKYSYIENQIPKDYIKAVIDEKMPRYIETFFENLLAKTFGMKKIVIEQPQIDIALVKFKKLSMVAEVRWKDKIKNSELELMAEKLNMFDCERLIIVPDKEKLKTSLDDIKIIDVKDLF